MKTKMKTIVHNILEVYVPQNTAVLLSMQAVIRGAGTVMDFENIYFDIRQLPELEALTKELGGLLFPENS